MRIEDYIAHTIFIHFFESQKMGGAWHHPFNYTRKKPRQEASSTLSCDHIEHVMFTQLPLLYHILLILMFLDQQLIQTLLLLVRFPQLVPLVVSNAF